MVAAVDEDEDDATKREAEVINDPLLVTHDGGNVNNEKGDDSDA